MQQERAWQCKVRNLHQGSDNLLIETIPTHLQNVIHQNAELADL